MVHVKLLGFIVMPEMGSPCLTSQTKVFKVAFSVAITDDSDSKCVPMMLGKQVEKSYLHASKVLDKNLNHFIYYY